MEVPADAWEREGVLRFRIPSFERNPKVAKLAEQILKVKKIVRNEGEPGDRALGRTIFARTCQECHILFGLGNKVGPELTTHPKRLDLDFLITNIVNPSAEISKGFEPKFIVTSVGLVYNGIVKATTDDSVTIHVGPKVVVIRKDEIEDMKDSKLSVMPTELLQDLSPQQVRSLFAYLTGARQSPLLAMT